MGEFLVSFHPNQKLGSGLRVASKDDLLARGLELPDIAAGEIRSGARAAAGRKPHVWMRFQQGNQFIVNFLILATVEESVDARAD
jgi:hypothetical protein